MNQEQAEKLYEKALDFANLSGDETVIDAYCGTGTISLYLAQKAKHVIGIEIIKDAIENAKENAKRNKIKNVEFHAADAADYLSQAAKKGKSADIIVLDPIRAGCSEKVIDAISEIKPKKIVYISCNVSTLARDIERLTQKGYTLQKVQPVDMFPETMHVEVITLLSKLDSKKYISVELPMDDMDLTSAESKATYKQIQNYVLEKFGFKVSTLYIAQVKKKHGLEVREPYNISKNDKQKIPQCPIEKEEAILDALKHFNMVYY